MIGQDIEIATKKTIDVIKEYMNKKRVDKVVISSTTGYTAKIFEDIGAIEPDECYICKQDLNEKIYMEEEVKRSFEKKGYHVVEIPKKYLTDLIGIKSVNILRSFSQGTKVCIELLEFLISQKDVISGENVILVAGTVKGADTAICASLNKSGYALDIIKLPER